MDNNIFEEVLETNKKLMELTKNEYRINLIMDNTQIHKAKITKIVA